MPCTVVFYVLIEMFVDQSKSLERRGVKMGGNLCEDFLRDSKKFILSAILELGTGDRLRSGFLKHCSFPGNLVGAIKHKTGEILGVRRATQTQSDTRWLRGWMVFKIRLCLVLILID